MTNNPAIQIGNNKVYSGHNLDVLKHLPNNSIDSIVTDPPYELGFMSKTWDKSGIAYSVELWQECLRVLKPGGHLLAFGGTRTWHRLAVAIEDAGFEIRDSIAWLYGSGFPKSHNISKAIDKLGGNEGITIRNEIAELIMASGLSDEQIALVAEVSPALVRFWRKRERNILVTEANKIKKLLGNLVPQQFVGETIGHSTNGIAGGSGKHAGQENAYGFKATYYITSPATEQAKKWDGWGTALKPAHEPIVVARKPVVGTVAENVLQFGVGALNIDASRIGTEVISVHNAPVGSFAGGEQDRGSDTESYREHIGRWPANIILDETTAELLDEQSGNVRLTEGGQNIGKFNFAPAENTNGNKRIQGKVTLGGASRFFYVAKASKRDRNEGLDELPDQILTGRDEGQDERQVPYKTRSNPVKNIHPTVKPTLLMQYLIRLVTPDNGVVLDPFTGSGSTGKAAILEGYKFIGIELTAEYLPIIAGRLQHAYDTYNNKTDDLFE